MYTHEFHVRAILMKKYGSRLEVFTGLAERTKGGKGLRREDLVMGTNGRIASKRLSDAGKRRWAEGGMEAFGKAPKENAAEVVADGAAGVE